MYDFVDYTDPKVRDAALKAAFDAYVPKNGGRVGRGRLDGKQTQKVRGKKRDGKFRQYEQATLFNFERTKKILQYIALSSFIGPASSAAGVTPKTLGEWLRRGRSESEKEETEGTPYAVFYRAFDMIAAGVELAHVGKVHSASMRGDVNASMDLLTHRWPQRWGNLAKHVVENVPSQRGKPKDGAEAVIADAEGKDEAVEGRTIQFTIVDETAEGARVREEQDREAQVVEQGTDVSKLGSGGWL